MLKGIGVSLLAAFTFALGGLVACGPSQPESATPARDQARGAILTIAEAVKTGDAVCAQTAITLKKPDLAKACADAYDDARSALLAAESGIDAWTEGAQGQVACAGGKALQAIVQVENLLASNGVKTPTVMVDAVKLGQMFLPLCTIDGGSNG